MSYQDAADVTKLKFQYNTSPNFLNGSWQTPTGSPYTLTGGKTFGATSPIGSHHNLGYANLNGNDVLHINYLYESTGHFKYSHIRSHFSGTTLTVDSDTDPASNGNGSDAVSTDGGPPYAVGGCVARDGHPIAFADGGLNGGTAAWLAYRSLNADDGTSWTDDIGGAGGASVFSGSNTDNVQSVAVIRAGATTTGNNRFGSWFSPNGLGASVATPLTNITGWVYTSGGTFTDTPGFTTITQEAANNFGVVSINPQDLNTNVHMVLRTSANTFVHKTCIGTTTANWANGQSIPSQAMKTGEGIALTTNGVDMWMFIIANDTANTVLGIKWTASVPSWGTWFVVEGSPKTRTAITVCNSAVDSGFGLMWTEVNGGTFDIVGTYFKPYYESGAKPKLGYEVLPHQSFGGNCW